MTGVGLASGCRVREDALRVHLHCRGNERGRDSGPEWCLESAIKKRVFLKAITYSRRLTGTRRRLTDTRRGAPATPAAARRAVTRRSVCVCGALCGLGDPHVIVGPSRDQLICAIPTRRLTEGSSQERREAAVCPSGSAPLRLRSRTRDKRPPLHAEAAPDRTSDVEDTELSRSNGT